MNLVTISASLTAALYIAVDLAPLLTGRVTELVLLAGCLIGYGIVLGRSA